MRITNPECTEYITFQSVSATINPAASKELILYQQIIKDFKYNNQEPQEI